MPTGAACAESRVPSPAPSPARAARRYSPATSSHSRRALQARCSPSPCGRLSRPPRPDVTPATTTRAPPRPDVISGRCALPAPQRVRRRHRDGSHVHCRSLVRVGAQLFPCGFAATLTRACVAIPSQRIHPPVRTSPPSLRGLTHRQTRPISIGFEPGSTLKGVLALVHFVTPFGLACRARTIR